MRSKRGLNVSENGDDLGAVSNREVDRLKEKKRQELKKKKERNQEYGQRKKADANSEKE